MRPILRQSDLLLHMQVRPTEDSPGVVSSSSKRIPFLISARDIFFKAVSEDDTLMGNFGPTPLPLRRTLSPLPLLVYDTGRLLLFLSSPLVDLLVLLLAAAPGGVGGNRLSVPLSATTSTPRSFGGVNGATTPLNFVDGGEFRCCSIMWAELWAGV